jgi:hypothetical protein
LRTERGLLIAVATIAAAAPSWVARAQGDAPQRVDVAVTVVCPPDGAGELVDQLRDIVLGGSAGDIRSLYLDLAPRFDIEELFRLPAVGVDRTRAWVVVDGATALVRVAAAGRERFVFRDLTVSEPLNDLDRERIGQTLKVALETVVEGGNAALGRVAARAAAGIDRPSSSSASVAPSSVRHSQDGESAPPPPVLGSDPTFRLGLGGFMEMARLRGNFAYGPGIIASGLVTFGDLRAGVWVLLMAFLPHDIATDSPSVIYGASFRGGINLAASELPWLSLDLGAGYDWPRPRYFGGGQKQIEVYRVAARLGPADLGGVRTAITLMLEYSSQSFDVQYEGVTEASDTRPALALELWWH